MGALALPLVASVVALATADARIDLRAESRTSTVAAEGLAPRRLQALIARPGVALRLDATPLRAIASYGARIWTSDVEAQPSPYVTQEARLRLETRHARPWRAGAAVSAVRGRTDPLADPTLASPRPELSQTTLGPVQYQDLNAGLDGSFPLDLRTTVECNATAWRSEGIGVIGREAMPLQRTAMLALNVSHLLSPRTRFRLEASGAGTRTEAPSGPTDSAWASATAELRRRLTRTLDAWAGAGAALSVQDAPGAAADRQVVPIGRAGVAHQRGVVRTELSVGAIPFTDRFTGHVGLMVQGAGSVGWRASPRLSFEAVASGGSLLSGDTALATLDARWRYALRRQLALEAGLVGRWQRERTGTAPSFAEVGAIVALAWEAGTAPR